LEAGLDLISEQALQQLHRQILLGQLGDVSQELLGEDADVGLLQACRLEDVLVLSRSKAAWLSMVGRPLPLAAV
jgi:hypothetical protein